MSPRPWLNGTSRQRDESRVQGVFPYSHWLSHIQVAVSHQVNDRHYERHVETVITSLRSYRITYLYHCCHHYQVQIYQGRVEYPNRKYVKRFHFTFYSVAFKLFSHLLYRSITYQVQILYSSYWYWYKLLQLFTIP